MQIIVEGWRHLPHSYAIINRFLLLEMLELPDLELFHRDMPYLSSDWQPVTELEDQSLATRARLDGIAAPPANLRADATFRIYCPFNLKSDWQNDRAPNCSPPCTALFAAIEWGIVEKSVIKGMGITQEIGIASFGQAHRNSDAIIVTPSHWSREGLLRSGAVPNRVAVIPLGADPNIYRPLPSQERTALRQAMGLDRSFVFFNNGLLCRDSQGIGILLKAFAAIVERYPEARLLLKGRDALFPSRDSVAKAGNQLLSEAELARIEPRIIYIGKSLSFGEMARLYQVADAYVSPYLAEGFNLPVLEAIASGLPVICTQGGATDDFTHPDFALAIASTKKTLVANGETRFAVVPNFDHLVALMETAIGRSAVRELAAQTGPTWVRSRFTWKHFVDRLLPVLGLGDKGTGGQGDRETGEQSRVRNAHHRLGFEPTISTGSRGSTAHHKLGFEPTIGISPETNYPEDAVAPTEFEANNFQWAKHPRDNFSASSNVCPGDAVAPTEFEANNSQRAKHPEPKLSASSKVCPEDAVAPTEFEANNSNLEYQKSRVSKIAIAGWRFVPHSYAIVNQFMLLEMLKRHDVKLFQQDIIYGALDSEPITGLFAAQAEAILRQIPPPPKNLAADALLRIYSPFNFHSSNARRTYAFATTEWYRHDPDLLNAIARGDGATTIITPSQWSKQGLIRAGVKPEQIAIVPLGVEPTIYKPVSEAERAALRKKFAWEGEFVFLNIGGMVNRKGICPLLQAFATIVERYPQARLVLKGSDYIYGSRDSIEKALNTRSLLTEAQANRVRDRLTYIGSKFSFAEIAQLYQAADIYISPYLAEGFNLPVLEAAACGLPVICTEGGPTDDFTHADFALKIESQFATYTDKDNKTLLGLAPSMEHLIALMERAIEQPAIGRRARKAGPDWVLQRYTWQKVVNQLLAVLCPERIADRSPQPPLSRGAQRGAIDSDLPASPQPPLSRRAQRGAVDSDLPPDLGGLNAPVSPLIKGGLRGDITFCNLTDKYWIKDAAESKHISLSQSSEKQKIVVEGWRNLTHSYAIVNQFQLLELLDRSCVELFHRDLPYLKPSWQAVPGLLEGSFEGGSAAKLEAIASPPPDLCADALFRIALPYNLQPGKAKKTCVFCTTEGGIVTQSMLAGMGVASIQEALGQDVTIVTPSHWSKSGFLRSGVDESRLAVLPHGVDTNIYKPLPEAERMAVRRSLGLEGSFAFLNIGILSPNKGIRFLLKAFAAIVDRYPQARLVLKGADSLFESLKFLREAAQGVLTEAEAAKVEPRLAYIGKSLSFAQMIRLYQAADAYVSPYLAEGFNMPVLEAVACGLPVICTKGGPTDDFTRRDFALPIESQLQSLAIAGETVFIIMPDLQHLIARMEEAIERSDFRQQARHTGPSFVAAHFTWKQVVTRLLEILSS